MDCFIVKKDLCSVRLKIEVSKFKMKSVASELKIV